MLDEKFVKEKINPILGTLFYSGQQLAIDDAPASMNMQYLEKATADMSNLFPQWTEILTADDLPKAEGEYLFKYRLLVPDQERMNYYESKSFSDFEMTPHNKGIWAEKYSHWMPIPPFVAGESAGKEEM